jgi:hypothetical protein
MHSHSVASCLHLRALSSDHRRPRDPRLLPDPARKVSDLPQPGLVLTLRYPWRRPLRFYGGSRPKILGDLQVWTAWWCVGRGYLISFAGLGKWVCVLAWDSGGTWCPGCVGGRALRASRLRSGQPLQGFSWKLWPGFSRLAVWFGGSFWRSCAMLQSSALHALARSWSDLLLALLLLHNSLLWNGG